MKRMSGLYRSPFSISSRFLRILGSHFAYLRISFSFMYKLTFNLIKSNDGPFRYRSLHFVRNTICVVFLRSMVIINASSLSIFVITSSLVFLELVILQHSTIDPLFYIFNVEYVLCTYVICNYSAIY